MFSLDMILLLGYFFATELKLVVDTDSPDVVTTDTPPSSFGSPPYFHQTQRGLEAPVTGRSALSNGHLLRSKSGGCELYQENFNPAAEAGAVVMGSPINIPRVEQQRDMGMFPNYIKPGVSATGFSNSGGSDNSADPGGSVGEGPSDPQPITQLGTPGSDDSVSITNRQLENLALHENGAISGVLRTGNGKSRWDMIPVVANGSLPQGKKQTSDPPTKTSILNPEFEAAFVFDDCGIHGSGGVVSDSPLDGSPAHGDNISGTAEDAESEDTEGARSKSEENENAEQGDDVWEGSMFPFCEEGEFLQLII